MAQLSQLLLFDPDPSGLDVLSSGFVQEGYSVTGTADPARARELVQSANLSLVVVVFREAEQAGLDLVRAISSNPRTRNLACVAIGRVESRKAALAAGAFAFLTVPLFVRDVIGVCRMVAAALVPGSRPSPDSELSLNLAQVHGIYFLVRAMGVTGRSAVVEVRHVAPHEGRKFRGELRFIEGTLTSAVVDSVQGLPALHQMLLWEEAALHFKFKNVVRRGAQLSMKGAEVLEECDRFLRDFAHEVKDLGVARTIYAAELQRVQPSPALPREVVPILKLFDGARDLSRILDESPFRIFDTLNIIKRFVQDGAIRLTTPPPASMGGVEGGPAATGPAALNLWQQKQAPLFGAELASGPGLRKNSPATAPPSGVARVKVGVPGSAAPVTAGPSPFVVLSGTPAPDGGLDWNDSIPASVRRTLTKKHVGDPAAVPASAAVKTKAAPVLAANIAPTSPAASSATPPEDVVTPPPVVRPTPAAAKPAPAMARGEIRITPPPRRLQQPAPTERQQSVVIELGVLPAPAPLLAKGPAPVSAQTPPPAAAPSVIVSVTPPPVVVKPAAVTPSPSIAGSMLAAPAPAPSLPASPPQGSAIGSLSAASAPSVIIAPMTPPPVLVPAAVPPATAALPATPAAPAPAAAAPVTPPPAVAPATPPRDNEASRPQGRFPSDSFSAVEADFFDREADLYKRESVESFDDLDTHLNGTRKR